MLKQRLLRYGNIQALGWGTCPKDAWRLMALRAVKGACLLYLKRHTEDTGIDVWTGDPGGGGGGAGQGGYYSGYVGLPVRITEPGLPEVEGADPKAVKKALEKEVKALVKAVYKTL